MKRGRPNQSDIAKAAQVSQSLVSLVLRGGSGDVAPATRDRILAEAQRLGYTPHRRRKSGRTRLLGYVRSVVVRGHHKEEWIYDSYETYYNRIQSFLTEAAFEAGYSLIVHPFSDAVALTNWLSEWNVEGVLWHNREKALAEEIAGKLPMVQIHGHSLLNADGVAPNPEHIILTAMEHLRSHGHERIAMIPAQPFGDPLRKIRNRAYADYTARNGLRNYLSIFPEDRPYEFQEMECRFLSLLQGPIGTRPTAAIIADHSALHIIRHAREHGIRIPEDLSIVGVDNISASQISTPPLTSIDLQNDQIAKAAIELLAERIENPDRACRQVLFTPRLVSRDSVCSLTPPSASTHNGVAVQAEG